MPAPSGHAPRKVAAFLSATLVVSLTTSACLGGGDGDGTTSGVRPSSPPTPTPALTQAEVKRVLLTFAARTKVIHKRYDRAAAATAYTGSSLQMEIAKYRVLKANRVPIARVKYSSVLGATPKFSGHPKWFFAAMTDRGSTPVRDISVFVQEKPGGPWLAAYTPVATKPVTGPLARGVDVADTPDVVPADDPALAVAPGQVATSFADVINRGSASPNLRAFTVPAWARTKRQNLLSDRKTFRSQGWTGTAAYGPAQTPVYAVRTTGGGALVWSAIELKESYRHTARGSGITWKHSSWGDLFKPFTGRSSLKKSMASVERIEMLTYVPPKGRGKILVLANRWAPLSITGS